MGAYIRVKVPSGRDVNSVIAQLRQALQSAGLKNIDFNVRKQIPTNKYNTPSIELNPNTLKLL